MIVHSALMGILEVVATEHGLPLVDFIAIVNRHPEYFASYVHLTETGNLALAEALGAVIATLEAGDAPVAGVPTVGER